MNPVLLHNTTMGKTPFIRDSYTDRPTRNFDFKLYLENIGFIASRLDNLRYFRVDGFNLRIVPGEQRTAELYNQKRSKSHVANFAIPESMEEARILFKSFNVINT